MWLFSDLHIYLNECLQYIVMNMTLMIAKMINHLDCVLLINLIFPYTKRKKKEKLTL